jgi:hypothetical protein
MEKEMNLRAEFEKEVNSKTKGDGVDWWKQSDRNYISWLEQKLKALSEPMEEVKKEDLFKAYGKPFTSGRHLWDWLVSNCTITLKPTDTSRNN